MSEERWSKKRVQGKNHLFVVEEENRVRLPPITRSDTTGERPGKNPAGVFPEGDGPPPPAIGGETTVFKNNRNDIYRVKTVLPCTGYET